MTLGVLVSSNLPCFIQMYVCFKVMLYELYPIDEKNAQCLSHWKVKVDYTCNKGMFISWFIFCVCSVGIYHIEMKKLSINIYESISSLLLVCMHLFSLYI